MHRVRRIVNLFVPRLNQTQVDQTGSLHVLRYRSARHTYRYIVYSTFNMEISVTCAIDIVHVSSKPPSSVRMTLAISFMSFPTSANVALSMASHFSLSRVDSMRINWKQNAAKLETHREIQRLDCSLSGYDYLV